MVTTSGDKPVDNPAPAGRSRRPKHIRRALRELAGKAYDLDLREALKPLAEAFKQWESGTVDSFALTRHIHEFHQGPARELYLRYSDGDPGLCVAAAIAAGVLDRREISPDVLDELAGLIELCEAR